jgi:uncharacterized protein YoxC
MKNLIIVIVAVAFVYLIFFTFRNASYNSKDLKKTIDSLNTQISIKEDSIKLARVQIDTLNHKIEIAEQKINENQVKIVTIYKRYETKIPVIDSYDINQLELFFSEKFKDSSKAK